ncbi:DUF2251 domain-containing protein [Pedobacter sp. MC2016-24]|uniref:DUF2251 domain-containing protein n=1 Tax=Pedobacter sp. MC2016-24 TaxID=2780090 RepID=UPI001880F935|nr:DUF2251 domain-containing protein [Pedobacter sp. MC2016-24]MBE9597972.1 DUF2251 domain-containing protein [Pedobacter sp. MC2016-24]
MQSNKPKAIIYEEQTFNVGEDVFIESTAENNYAVIFEDNGETGYLYAVDRNDNGLKILDALHIYDVANVTDKDQPSTAKILWTEDLSKAILSINNYYHAVVDFQNQAGYCRTGFPQPKNTWVKQKERKLTDSSLNELFKKIIPPLPA